jgi:acetolactate synthase I/II/III large subunit
MVAMAFRESLAGAPGPAFLEIGRDILDGRVPLERAVLPQPGHYRASTKSIGDPADIERLADILVKAERPCVLLGSQVWTCRGAEAATELVRTLNIPALMNGAARGTLAPGDPHHFHQTRRHAFNNADVIVIVGTPFDFRMGYGKRLSQEATVVRRGRSARASSTPACSRCCSTCRRGIGPPVTAGSRRIPPVWTSSAPGLSARWSTRGSSTSAS